MLFFVHGKKGNYLSCSRIFLSRSVRAMNMNMTITSTLVLALCFVFSGCKKEPPDLISVANQAQSITVYDLEGLARQKYSEQDLKRAFQSSFDLNLFQQLVDHAKFRPSHGFWKGSSLAVIELKDGTETRLALSYYGGFFKIVGTKGHFYFEDPAIRKRFDDAFMSIIYDDFIPKRIERNKRSEGKKP